MRILMWLCFLMLGCFFLFKQRQYYHFHTGKHFGSIQRAGETYRHSESRQGIYILWLVEGGNASEGVKIVKQ